MLFIIGTFRNSHGITALKVYDSTTQKMGLYPKNTVMSKVKSGKIQVAGIDLRPALGDKYGIEHEEYRLTKDLYNVWLLDQVDGLGKPITNNHTLVPIAAIGFGTTMKVKFVDSEGISDIKNYSDTMELINAKRTTGLRKRKDMILTHSMCEHIGVELGVGCQRNLLMNK